MMKKTRITLPVSVVAIFLAVAAFAWACTPDYHKMEVRFEPDSGLAGTNINVDGICLSPCTATSNRELYQSPNASGEVKVDGVNEHQTDCDTGDTDIGSVSTPNATTGAFDGSGTVVGPSGAKIICAGFNPALLWDNYTVI